MDEKAPEHSSGAFLPKTDKTKASGHANRAERRKISVFGQNSQLPRGKTGPMPEFFQNDKDIPV
ncbi:hypothetical protein RX717_00795 [Intestinibacillus sp. NTUH-41-i26]|uniref:hypothetical protein n=1 Tax=Butyricicoccaceae TaxID=3085642 RepID=UPI00131DD4C9|nr:MULTISPECIES: hypothetical protein [Butyricicoccaceae]WOC75565.1 hypothetical protein RX717_00795 [Intestinibacillus sp. NTUH-41-i26]